MPWFHATSLSETGDHVPEIACRGDVCYRRAAHTRSSRLFSIEGPRLALDLDNPCRHVIVHTDAAGERYIWASHVTRCRCGCDGVLLEPDVDWDDNLRTAGAFFPGLEIEIPLGLSIGTFNCAGCGYVHPSGNHGYRSFTDPDSDGGDVIEYCGDCARDRIGNCADCDREMLRGNMQRLRIRGDNDYRVCGHCYYNYSSCCHCGLLYDSSVEEAYCCNDALEGNSAYLDNCRCYSCTNTRRYHDRVIRNYSYKPDPVFKYIGDGDRRLTTDQRGIQVDRTPYLGFELEVEVDSDYGRDDVAKRVQDGLGSVAYIKEDGSIHHGFEIVTHPMTLAYAISQFDWSVLRTLRKERKLLTGDNCGLHVHVSKAGFSSPAHEYRWLLFWHRNQVAMRSLAGRDSSYAEYRDDHRSQFRAIVDKRNGQVFAERYSAINTNNQHTHEVRVFASTLYVNRLKASLQLVEATVEYTRILASSKVMQDGGFSWHEFVMWLTGNARKYADLIERIRTVVKLTNSEPITAETTQWGVRNRYSGYVDNWVTRALTIQEKATI